MKILNGTKHRLGLHQGSYEMSHNISVRGSWFSIITQIHLIKHSYLESQTEEIPCKKLNNVTRFGNKLSQ